MTVFRPDGVFLCSRRLRYCPSVAPSFELFGLYCYVYSIVSSVTVASVIVVIAYVTAVVVVTAVTAVVLDSFIS